MESPSAPNVPLPHALTVVSDLTRWRILNELAKGEPLPVKEVARRIGLPPGNVSKHFRVLRDFGIVVRGFGNLYRIAPAYMIPGERAIDLGPVVLRLDRVEKA